jgi:hypothetical protein
MATTYIPLYTTTLASAVSSVTINPISAGYTDLVLVVNATVTTGLCNVTMTFGDTSTLYSRTNLIGNGSTAVSNRQTNEALTYICTVGTTSVTSGMAQIMNYANTNTFKTYLLRDTYAASAVIQRVGLWRNTAAISTIVIGNDGGTTFAAGSTFSLYGVTAANVGAKATGGDFIGNDGSYFYHVFNSSGTFTPSQALTCDYLVVAGGGGGGVANFNGNATSGGGGAGGLRSTVTATGGGGTLETALALASGTGYTITIGAGGAGSTAQDSDGTNGSNSVFSTITSVGGGYGSSRNTVGTNRNPSSGGSGGGGGLNVNGAAGTTNQGFAGGNPTDTNNSGAGGGGAGGVGGNSGSNTPGVAGLGLAVGITGSLVTYATGGRGRQTNPVDGTSNTGTGGDGGSTSSGSPTRGGNGGSGIVIVRYPI